MNKITVYGYDTTHLRKLLCEAKISYRIVNDIKDIEATQWLLVDERLILSNFESIKSLGYSIIVICKSITHIKVKKFLDIGIEDYILAPIIGAELFRRIRLFDEEEYKQEADTRLSLAIDVASIGIWEYELETDDLIWDKSMFEIHHLPIDSKLYSLSHWLEIIHSDERHIFNHAINTLINSNETLDISYKIKNIDKHIRMTAYLVSENNLATRLVGTCLDITDHIKIQEENAVLELEVERNNDQREEMLQSLQLAQERLDTTLNVSNIGYWEWSVDKQISFENDQWFEMLGYDKATFELNDKPFHGLMHPEDLEVMSLKLERIASGLDQIIDDEFRLLNADGKWSWILARGQILEYLPNGKVKTVSGVHINITDRKQLEQQRKMLSEAVSNSPVGIVVTDTAGMIDYVNPAFCEMTGYSSKELLGHTTKLINSGYHKNAFYKELWETVSSGNQWKGIFFNKKKNGELYWESSVISPMFDENGTIVSYVAVKEDITLEKERENKIIERNKRLTRQQWILQSLTKSNELTDEEMEISLKIIIESVVSGLEVTSCSICYIEDMNTRLRCFGQWDDKNQTFSETILHLDDYRDYFEVILSGSQVMMTSSDDIKYTSMYNNLKKHNIYASLHMPIWYRGEVIGVIRAEHEMEVRSWVPDEIGFLRAMSDLLTIRLETKERLKAQQNAEDASKSKSDFLANMSHEIRTPLNAVIGLSHLALQTEMTPKQEDYLIKINDAAQHLLVLINDILDFSKAEAGKITLEHIVFSIDLIFSHLESMTYDKAKEKGLDIIIDIDDNLPRKLIGDPYRLVQILLNLVSNAIKFTNQGRVTIKVERVFSDVNNEDYIMLKFSVSDTGIGLSEPTIETLFESFEQGETSTTRQFGGTGLGLSISRQLVALYGGSIQVESVEGEGSTFFFTANFELSDAEITVKQSYISYDVSSVSQSIVLIVEDNKINQQIISEVLESRGIQSRCVNNGQEAVDYLESGEPCGLILMDLQMPVLDGYEASKQIRNNHLYQHIPIIATSADSRLEVKIETLNHGMNDFIIKPIDQEVMVSTVTKWMNQKPFSLRIQNVDTDLGLRRCNNNEELYISILKKLSSGHKGDIIALKTAIENGTGEETKILHTLKGLMGHIGSVYMHNYIEGIEDFVNNRKRGYKNKLHVLAEELDKMLMDINGAVSVYTYKNQVKETDHDEVNRLFNQLNEPLLNGSINEIILIMKQLERFNIHNMIETTYETMRKQIRKYQYDYAEINLKSILARLEDLNG
jgi:PAS domain S-box-containing protein